jgi:DTW domain-containing protein YfiP
MSRQYCYTCMRALCLCSKLNTIHNQMHVIILQDPNERGNAKNTARLLHLSLANSELIVANNFSNELRKIKSLDKYLLIFPDLYAKEDKVTKVELKELKEISHNYKGLILIDGTWKKAKKIYFTHPLLQGLDHLTLKGLSNHYSIRVSPQENYLSTFEAGYFALRELKTKNIDKIYQVFNNLNEIEFQQMK